MPVTPRGERRNRRPGSEKLIAKDLDFLASFRQCYIQLNNTWKRTASLYSVNPDKRLTKFLAFQHFSFSFLSRHLTSVSAFQPSVF